MGASQYTQTMRTFEKILEDGRRSQWIDLGDEREETRVGGEDFSEGG